MKKGAINNGKKNKIWINFLGVIQLFPQDLKRERGSEWVKKSRNKKVRYQWKDLSKREYGCVDKGEIHKETENV